MRTYISNYDTVYSRAMGQWVERPVVTAKSLTNEEIESILNLYSDKTQIQLTPPESASEFWQVMVFESLLHSIFNSNTKKWEQDYAKYYNSDVKDLRAYALQFASCDGLAIVNKSGKLLRRFAKYVKKNSGHDVDSVTMGKLGDKLQYYLCKNTDLIFDFVQGIDWDDGMYGHSGSCWWNEYRDSVPTFNAGGGWAIRFYNSMTDRKGCGRTWIVPKYNAIIGFNSYGVDRPQVIQVLTQIFQSHGITLTFRNQEIHNYQDSTIPYINSGTGFILYENSTTIDESGVDIDMVVESDENSATCDSCGDRLSEDNSFYSEISGCDYCESCYCDRFSRCEKCGKEVCNDDMVTIQDSRQYTDVCESCASELGAVKCDCDRWNVDNYRIAEDGDYAYCDHCFDSHIEFTCEECGCSYEYTDGCESCSTGSCAPVEESESAEDSDSGDELVKTD